jgi:hypothetical protein
MLLVIFLLGIAFHDHPAALAGDKKDNETSTEIIDFRGSWKKSLLTSSKCGQRWSTIFFADSKWPVAKRESRCDGPTWLLVDVSGKKALALGSFVRVSKDKSFFSFGLDRSFLDDGSFFIASNDRTELFTKPWPSVPKQNVQEPYSHREIVGWVPQTTTAIVIETCCGTTRLYHFNVLSGLRTNFTDCSEAKEHSDEGVLFLDQKWLCK